MKKIVFITHGFYPNDGLSNITLLIMKELSKFYDISVFTFFLKGQYLENRFAEERITVNFFTDTHEHNLSQEIRYSIRHNKVVQKLLESDLILISDDRPVPIPIMLARRRRSDLPIVWDFPGLTPLHLQRPDTVFRYLIEVYRRMVAKNLMKYCNYCIVHSIFERLEVEEYFAKLPTFVVPYGIDTNRFNPNVDGSSIIDRYVLHDKFVLLYVGRLVPHKRVDFVLKALYRLNDPTVALLIVGTGREEHLLKKLVDSYKLRDKVFFTGQVTDDELPKYYSAANAFVTASVHEGFGLPPAEALATGKPAIVPNIAALPETVDGGGLVYDPYSIDNLVNKIKLLRNDKGLYDMLREHGFRVITKYSIESTTKRYIDCLERVLF